MINEACWVEKFIPNCLKATWKLRVDQKINILPNINVWLFLQIQTSIKKKFGEKCCKLWMPIKKENFKLKTHKIWPEKGPIICAPLFKHLKSKYLLPEKFRLLTLLLAYMNGVLYSQKRNNIYTYSTHILQIPTKNLDQIFTLSLINFYL